MAHTDLREYGTSINHLTDKEKLFCGNYLQTYDAKNSAIKAGYASRSAASTASKILKKKHIQKYLGKNQRLSAEKFEVERDEILQHLAAAATRDGKDFFDSDGVLVTNIRNLPPEVTRSIDNIKQKKWRNEAGEIVTETEIRLVSKAAALRMALEHKGLFAPQQVEHTVGLNWDQLYAQASIEQDDIIEVGILEGM